MTGCFPSAHWLASWRLCARALGTALWCAACLWMLGCVDTGAGRVPARLVVQGVDASESFAGRDGWTIELDRAELAFGGLTLCPGVQAGDLCEEARAEVLEPVRIDGLDPAPREVAEISALATTVRSAMWNYGVRWPLTSTEPVVDEAAADGSVVLEGVARRPSDAGERVLPFRASLILEPAGPGVVVVRASRLFDHDIEAGDTLRVSIDPRAWVSTVQFDALFDATTPGETAVFAEDSQATRAVVTALTTRAQPRLSWND